MNIALNVKAGTLFYIMIEKEIFGSLNVKHVATIHGQLKIMIPHGAGCLSRLMR